MKNSYMSFNLLLFGDLICLLLLLIVDLLTMEAVRLLFSLSFAPAAAAAGDNDDDDDDDALLVLLKSYS